MEAKDVRFNLRYKLTIQRLNWFKNVLRRHFVLTVFFKYRYLLVKNKIILSKIIFNFFFFKFNSLTPDPDPNCAKILDPDPNSMYLNLQHWL